MNIRSIIQNYGSLIDYYDFLIQDHLGMILPDEDGIPVEGDDFAEVPAEDEDVAEEPVDGDDSAEDPAQDEDVTEAPVEGDDSAEVPADEDVAEEPVDGDDSAEVPAQMKM